MQYRETAFNFVSRLMEQEGIFYFFQHENGKHTMVLAITRASRTAESRSTTGSMANLIASWEHQYEFRSGKWAADRLQLRDAEHEPAQQHRHDRQLPDAPKYEIFDYPGEYDVKADGDALTKRPHGGGEAALRCGHRLEPMLHASRRAASSRLHDHDVEAEASQGYVVTSIQHTRRAMRRSPDRPHVGKYSNVFTCIPDSVVVPPRAHHAEADRAGPADGRRRRAERARRSSPTSTAG